MSLDLAKVAESSFLLVKQEFWWFLKAAGRVNTLPQEHFWEYASEGADIVYQVQVGVRVHSFPRLSHDDFKSEFRKLESRVSAYSQIISVTVGTGSGCQQRYLKGCRDFGS